MWLHIISPHHTWLLQWILPSLFHMCASYYDNRNTVHCHSVEVSCNLQWSTYSKNHQVCPAIWTQLNLFLSSFFHHWAMCLNHLYIVSSSNQNRNTQTEKWIRASLWTFISNFKFHSARLSNAPCWQQACTMFLWCPRKTSWVERNFFKHGLSVWL